MSASDARFDRSQPHYQSLRKVLSERSSPVVFFVGAGPSTAAGIPSWHDLKSQLIEVGRRDAETQGDREDRLAELKQIEAEANNWVGFERLKRVIGNTTYREAVRASLISAPTVSVPETYIRLWRVRPNGILTLNLDRLLTRAYQQVLQGRAEVTDFCGINAGSLVHILKSPRQFIGNLHGVWEDTESWIFTHSELRSLHNSDGFDAFVVSCAASRVIVFIGITAEDVAAGGLLEGLTKKGIDLGLHYWITDRKDAATRDWAEKAGILQITYDSNGGHEAALCSMLDDLRTYVSHEDDGQPDPIIPRTRGESALPTEAELLRIEDANTVRHILNAHAASILQPQDDEAYQAYESFCQEYDQAIHRAWYTSVAKGRNALLGYRLEEEVAQGAFGRVYRAHDSNGKEVAVKVLLEEVRRKTDLLQCFRRGVRSMRILSERNVAGMVPYRDASEIPAFVAMDWIDGPNLEQATSGRMLTDWRAFLRVATALSGIVRKGHNLAERVLHRDIRPANVMLKGFHTDENWEVVVLDFDLSWHRDALEKSILPGNAVVGYLAPEQMDRIHGATTRHTAVDSFGFGMTMFFMILGRNPIAGEFQSSVWNETVRAGCRRYACQNWRSLPERMARLIIHCTRASQAARWDFALIDMELKRLLAAETGEIVPWADMCAEEVVAQWCDGNAYTWDEDRGEGSRVLPSGIEVKLGADEARRRVTLTVKWASAGMEDRKRLGKWIPQAVDKAAAILRRNRWTIKTRIADAQSFLLIGECGVPGSREKTREFGNVLRDVCEAMTFK